METMKKLPTMFLQAVVVLIGIGALAFLLGEPHFEGRNVNATLFEIYFKDAFLAYAYLGSIAFFVALYQTFNILGSIRHDTFFSSATLKAARTIQSCAKILIGFALGAEVYFFVAMRGKDDIAGGVAMGLVAIFLFVIMAAKAAILERIVRNTLQR